MTRAAASAGSTRAGNSARSRGGNSSGAARSARSAPPDSYLTRSELPLTSLAFLLPLIVLYEIGTRAFVTDPVHQTEQRIIAFSLMQRFFLLFGASGKYLPALAVPGILLAWHIARRDRWKIKTAHVGGMALESIVLALPLVVVGRAAEQYLAHVSLAGDAGASVRFAGTKGLVVLSLGAGVYEELMFRLIAFTVFSFLLVDVLEMNKKAASLLMVVASAALFSAYHYLGGESFRWWTFAFRTIAGLYFGLVFFCRGFGITAGCHAAYDLCVVSLSLIG